MAARRATRELDAVRGRLAAAKEERSRFTLALARAEAELARAHREHGDDHPRTRSAARNQKRAAESLAGVRRQLRELEGALTGALDEFLRDRIEDDFDLDASLPIVLLPVRIETRFQQASDTPELLIRVYPDEIAADPHEPALTDEERAAGERYWTTVWGAPDRALNAWRTLLGTAQPTRGAWIVKLTTPMNADASPRPESPDFPTPPAKPQAWTRGVEARVLPDRWIALGFRGGHEVARAVSRPVTEPLVLSLGPDLDDETAVDLSGDGLTVDPALVWTVDFAAAEAAGMALRMPLLPEDARAGFDQLFVLGVKSSLDPETAGVRLGELLDAHHYSQGLAFVPQGTPTNNTRSAPSGFPPADPDGSRSFATELGPPLATADTNGSRVAEALGVPASAFDHIDGADRDEQAGARAMSNALWPATWGYFLEQLLDIDEDDASIDRFRRYFTDHVRARGHLPAFRVGGTPYGLLVASSLARWSLRRERSSFENVLPDELRRLLPIWARQIARVPRAGASGDPDADLLKVLEMDASTREVRVRRVLGPDTSFNLFSLLVLNWTIWGDERSRMALEISRILGRDQIGARLFTVSYDERSFQFGGGFVTARQPDGRESLSETAGLDFNYITWLRTASVADLRAETFPAGVTKPRTLLYALLRHAFLRQIGESGDRVLVRAEVVTKAARRDAELVGMRVADTSPEAAASQPTAPTVWERLDQSVPDVTGPLPLWRFLLEVQGQPDTAAIEAYRASLATLETLPTAELERLLTETLDVCSHRLDAWISSLYAERLRVMREQRPNGAHLGAFGWVEDLRPAPSGRRIPVPPDRLRDIIDVAPAVRALGALETQVSTGGHIHAPSMTHAAAAAILRSGYLSRRGENRERYNVKLTSARVRAARFLLDAVRNGQPLGAVLGYRFERGLHEGHRPLELDKYIEPFRVVFPLVANKLTPAEPDEPAETLAARNVVDGLALHAAWQKNEIPFGTRGLPPATGTDRDAVEAELKSLDEAIDSVADLLIAESVFQIVRGSAATASATLDSLARGVRPPDPEIARAPRGGTALIHRVALILGGAAISPSGWDDILASPRSRAEPFLDGWIGSLVGDPENVRCTATYTDAADPSVRHAREVRLSQLGLRPIDLLAAMTTSDTVPQVGGARPATAQASEIDARIAFLVLGESDAAEDADVEIQYATSDRTVRGFAEIAELIRAVAALLGTSRALAPPDLLAPDRAQDAASAETLDGEAANRGNQAVSDLEGTIASLTAALVPLDVDPRPTTFNLGPLRQALIRATDFGVASAMPGSRKGNRGDQLEALLVQAKSVRGELERRRDAAVAATSPAGQVSAVFGEQFRFLPRFIPVAGELDQALNIGPVPSPTSSSVRRWLHGGAQTRPPIKRLRHVTMLGSLLGTPAVNPRIAQLPHAASPWAAEPFGDEANRPPSGIVSLALLRVAEPATDDPWVGLVVDEFTELVPNSIESSAVAFHYDDPGAEAPQAVLVAVPPGNEPTWSLDALVAVLRETLELAKIRAVDGELLEQLSQVLPATYLAANPKNDTISTHFAELLIQDAVIVRGT